MNSCSRCGKGMAHNYLVAMFRTIDEKVRKVLVCLKCKEILNAVKEK